MSGKPGDIPKFVDDMMKSSGVDEPAAKVRDGGLQSETAQAAGHCQPSVEPRQKTDVPRAPGAVQPPSHQTFQKCDEVAGKQSVQPVGISRSTAANIVDDELFSKVVRQSNHILHPLLPTPSTASQRYNLRHRVHSLQLPEHATQLSDSNFLTRMLYKNTY